MKLKLGDVLVLKDDRGGRKAGEMIQVDETTEKGAVSGELYWLSFETYDKWWAAHYFRQATDREAFLYHVHGSKALIKEEQ